MKIVHFSDLHLGYRQYQRQTSMGINQREADIAASFQRAIERVIELRPDIVLIAGDIFHTVRPSNPAILHAFTQFARLSGELNESLIVMIAGNHDTPRTAETGCILKLFAPLGIHVIDSEPQRISWKDGEVSVLAVPYLHGEFPEVSVDPTAKYNVLVAHGAVEGVIPDYQRYIERSVPDISRDQFSEAKWDYVGLGHYHVYQKVGHNAYYSGSLDYTSFDLWGELREESLAGISIDGIGGKGLIEHDLATGEHIFHSLPVSRQVTDLRNIDAASSSAASVDEAIQQRISECPGGIDDRIVRIVVRDIPRHVVHELDHKAIREYKKRALHFHLDTRRPELRARSSVSGSPVKRPSLSDIVREKLQGRPLLEDMSREKFVGLGLEYLQNTAAIAVPSAALSEEDGR